MYLLLQACRVYTELPKQTPEGLFGSYLHLIAIQMHVGKMYVPVSESCSELKYDTV